MNRARPALMVILLLSVLPLASSMAAPSVMCDGGDIADTWVQIDGVWYERPDPSIDGQPHVHSLGPFPVRARLLADSPITSVVLYWSASCLLTPSSQPMTIGTDGTLLAEIDALPNDLQGFCAVRFYIGGYDSSGRWLEWDEIPYGCDWPPDYPGGDPFSFVVERPHRIDIRPGSDPNGINPGSGGNLPVAILTDEDFDAQEVAPDTVRFGPGDASALRWHFKDVDGDGDLDLVLHFKTSETGITCGDTLARLEGETQGGDGFMGMDFVKPVGCE